jgi:hypothetical protein
MRRNGALRRRVRRGIARDVYVWRQHRLLPRSELLRFDADGCRGVQRGGRMSRRLDEPLRRQPHLQYDGNRLPDELQHEHGLRQWRHLQRRNVRIGWPGQRNELLERHAMPERYLRR